MASDAEIQALLPILEDPDNGDISTEELAARLILALGQVKSYVARQERLARQRAERELVTLAVVAQYSLDGGESLHHAVLGPFATPAEGRQAAAGFVGRPTQPGQGRFMLVPAYANTRDAWAAIKPADSVRRAALALARTRTESGWNPWAPHGPVCRCGVRPNDGTARDSGLCPVHPERTV